MVTGCGGFSTEAQGERDYSHVERKAKKVATMRVRVIIIINWESNHTPCACLFSYTLCDEILIGSTPFSEMSVDIP